MKPKIYMRSITENNIKIGKNAQIREESQWNERA